MKNPELEFASDFLKYRVPSCNIGIGGPKSNMKMNLVSNVPSALYQMLIM
jgi:hypothetical protein